MPRLVSLAALAIALLGGGSLAAISRTTRPQPARLHRDVPLEIATPPDEAPVREVTRAPAGPAAQGWLMAAALKPARPEVGSSAPAARPSSKAPAAGPAAPAHRPGRARRLLRAKQIREQVLAQRDGGPGRIGGLRFPSEEGTAMAAQGIDWSGLEHTTEGGAAPEGGVVEEEIR